VNDTPNLHYDDLPDNLTVADLKAFLRVGWNTAYKIADQIPHYRSGNRRLFPKEKVKEWTLKQAEIRAMQRLRAVR
jgi:excisionase family DNA binding protein